MTVYTVEFTYWDESYVVDIFDNEEAAQQCAAAGEHRSVLKYEVQSTYKE